MRKIGASRSNYYPDVILPGFSELLLENPNFHLSWTLAIFQAGPLERVSIENLYIRLTNPKHSTGTLPGYEVVDK